MDNKKEERKKVKNKDEINNEQKKVKVVISSLKQELEDNQENNDINKDNKKIKDDAKKVGFFKTFYYSTIKLDKISYSLESNSKWFSYIVILILLLSLIYGLFIGTVMLKRLNNFKIKLNELPEIKYKEGQIIGDIDTIFIEENSGRLIILNTIDNLSDIRIKYKEEIDKVEQYILITKDTIYAEPGDSFEYTKFNFLEGKEFDKQDINDFFEFMLRFNSFHIISGIISALIILIFIAVITFFVGRFIITLFSLSSLKIFDFKRINKLAIYLMTMPYLVYIILEILSILNIFKIYIDKLLVFYIIYIIYIILALMILRKKYSTITVIKDVEDLKNLLDINTKNTIEELENEEEIKRQEKKKLKEKSKSKNKEKQERSKQKEEIGEGA